MEAMRAVAYLFKTAEGRLIYVSELGSGYHPDSFKFYIGSPKKLVKVKILKIARYLDGGTTIILTEIGRLYCPSRLLKDKVPTWQSNDKDAAVLTKLDPEKYDIVELEDRATVIKKKKK